MKKTLKSGLLVLLASLLLLGTVSCKKNHVSAEVKSICEQGLAYTDDFLTNKADVQATFTKLYTLYAFWTELKIEPDQYTMTPNFQAKSTYLDLLHAFESQASGKDSRKMIASLRNTLATYAGLKTVEYEF